jgi:hypothetical protein
VSLGATLALENFETCTVKIPGRTDGAKGQTTLRLDLDRHLNVIDVYRDQDDEWLGEITHEQWAQWSDRDRADVLSDMLTWPPCNRGDRKVQDDKGALECLAAFARLQATA